MAADLFGRRDVRLGLAVASSALIAIPVYQYVRRAYFEWRYPWVEIGKVEHLYVYPIKSCKGNEVETLKCELLGPSSGEDFDRFFLVIDDETNHFYTSRQMPKLMLLEAHVKENVLELRTPDGKQLGVNLEKILKDHITRPSTLFHKERQDGLDCGDDVASFITDFLNLQDKPCRLVYYQQDLYSDRRLTTSQNWWNNAVPIRTDEHSFVDNAPYHAFSLASVDYLNEQLQSAGVPPVTHKNFRPNIVVSGPPPHNEDRWLQLRINNTEFVCYRPCDRCVMTTITPDTASKNPESQPIKKLREYRLAPEGKMRAEFKQSPIFGVYMGLIKSGTVNTGDAVFARYKSTPF